MTLTRITLRWEDASSHGHVQWTSEEFARLISAKLTPGMVTGWLVDEDKATITVALEVFRSDVDGPPDFRNFSTYPKSLIRSLKREKVKF